MYRLAIGAASLVLGEARDEAVTAVREHRLDSELDARLRYRSLAVSPHRSGPELAAAAAGVALQEAGWDSASLDLILHAWSYYQGHDFWSPAHFVAREVGAPRAEAIGIAELCNAGVTALSVAATRLAADERVRRCLVTTGDRFAEPAFDRWASDGDSGYGDAGTAVLLGRGQGALGLVAIETETNAEFEAWHRGADSFSATPGWHRDAIDVRTQCAAFLTNERADRFHRWHATAIERVVKRALDAICSDATPDTLSALQCVVLPRIGAKALDLNFRGALAGMGVRTVIDPGRDTGHLGAGDTAAALAMLADGGLDPGQYALVLAVGGGFTVSCVAVCRA
jgi:3-oxoacyl-[acyl-carrier-protein] synthase-3